MYDDYGQGPDHDYDADHAAYETYLREQEVKRAQAPTCWHGKGDCQYDTHNGEMTPRHQS